MAACSDDGLKIALPDNYDFDEGDLVEVSLGLNVDEFTVTSGSRAYSEEATDAEKKIDNIWLFQYDADGNQLINPRYYTISDQSQISNVPVLLKGGVPSTIYVVANTGSSAWANSANRAKFYTLANLEAQETPNNFAQEGTDLSLPMCGSIDGVIVSDAVDIVVPLIRMVAKIKIKVNIGKDKWEYKNINVQNIPTGCRIASRMTQHGVEAADYGTTAQWYTRSHAKKNSDIGEYDYILYIPECIHGIKTGATQKTKIANAPLHALNVYVEIKYTEGIADNEFTVYPGANVDDNYNIERNHVYDVKLQIAKPERGAEDVPSANCIVVHSNSSAEFQPYCRAEIGSLNTTYDGDDDRYAFSTYLDQNNPDKTIDYVKIIWQTVDVIGDNSDGDKVYLIKNEYNTADEDLELRSTYYRYIDGDDSAEDYHTITSTTSGMLTGAVTKTIWTIHVDTKNTGNALIGGYKKATEDGQPDVLLWSWHIWCTDLEPDNIGNSLNYTTYAWENNVIYPNDAANTWNPSHPRIPGYGLMPLALGAMATDPPRVPIPSNGLSEVTPTFGLVYQWGRKDPFPNCTRSITPDQTNWITEKVVPLRGNHNETVQVTNNSTQKSVLFHPQTSTETEGLYNSGTNIFRYAIQNPTVFLCSTTQSNLSVNQQESASYHKFNYDWTPVHDNKLWGGLDPNDNKAEMQSCSYSGVTVYDNYGPEKTIFDPCPRGWRVAPANLWFSFSKVAGNPSWANTTSTSNQVNYNSQKTLPNSGYNGGCYLYLEDWQNGPSSFFSFPGILRCDGTAWGVFSCGNYHNANVSNNDKLCALHLHNGSVFKIIQTSSVRFRYKAMGGPIRCVRDRK